MFIFYVSTLIHIQIPWYLSFAGGTGSLHDSLYVKVSWCIKHERLASNVTMCFTLNKHK